MHNKDHGGETNPSEKPDKQPLAKNDRPQSTTKIIGEKSFVPETISSDKIDTLRKNIEKFDNAIQAAKDSSAKFWDVEVYEYIVNYTY